MKGADRTASAGWKSGHERPVGISVILLTFNHERFIAQAIDSVLAQQVDLPVELLILEDCSSDRTTEIVRNYHEQHPNRIRLFLSERNINTNAVTSRALGVARGGYVAFLDGDDYWSSPHKLQRQYEYLRNHRQCSLCFHNAEVLSEETPAPARLHVEEKYRRTLTLEEIIFGNWLPGSAPMVRREAIDPLPAWFEEAPFGDWPLYIVAAQKGDLGYLNQVLSVYRHHAGGLWSAAGPDRQLTLLLEFYDLLELHLDQRYAHRINEARAYYRLVYGGWIKRLQAEQNSPRQSP